MRSGVFCVNVLRAEHWAVAAMFSGGQKGESRFKDGAWASLTTGAPALIDALASFDCRVARTIAHGTHTIFLGQVEEIRLGARGKPLLYSDGQYAMIASLESESQPLHSFGSWGI